MHVNTCEMHMCTYVAPSLDASAPALPAAAGAPYPWLTSHFSHQPTSSSSLEHFLSPV